ncbi:MAG: hypothetical protein ACTHJ8_17530 [Mucilaginibacter sp.]
MKEKELQDELVSIRSMMERSSKFISLSGLSGILAGVYALIGAGFIYFSAPDIFGTGVNYDNTVGVTWNVNSSLAAKWVLITMAVLFASVITAYILSVRQARRKKQPIWGAVSRSLLFHMIVPLITGGILIVIFITKTYFGLIVPAMLIFYGLSLASVSSFTFGEVKYLGLLQVALGLVAAFFPGYGILFWALGFGVLHIVYGSMMYLRYDK